MKVRLPAPTKGAFSKAESVLTVIGAVVDQLVPILGTVTTETLKQYGRKNFEIAQEIFCSELRKGNIEILQNELYEEFIPIAFRFFEAARAGERIVILKKYAKFIGINISESKLNSGEFLSFSKALEGLTDYQIQLLSEFVKFSALYDINNHDESCSKIMQKIGYKIGIEFRSEREKVLENAFVLQSRGFLYSYGSSGLGGSGPPNFRASNYAVQHTNIIED